MNQESANIKMYKSNKTVSTVPEENRSRTGIVACNFGSPLWHAATTNQNVTKYTVGKSTNNFYLAGGVNATNIFMFTNNVSDSNSGIGDPGGGDTDSFTYKLDSSGKFIHHLLVRSDPKQDDRVSFVESDADDNIYMAGTTNSAAAVTPKAYNANIETLASATNIVTFSANTGLNAWLVKWNSSGVYNSSATISSIRIDQITGFAHDDTNNVSYLSSILDTSGNVTIRNFNSTTLTRSFALTWNVLIAKLNDKGSSTATEWTAALNLNITLNAYNSLSNTYDNFTKVFSYLCLDDSSNVYVACFGKTSIDISSPVDNDTSTLTTAFTTDASTNNFLVALVKYNPNLTPEWVAATHIGAAAAYSTVPALFSCAATTDGVYLLFESLATATIRGARNASGSLFPAFADVSVTMVDPGNFAALVKYKFTGEYVNHIVFNASVAGSAINRMTVRNDILYLDISFKGVFTAPNNVSIGVSTSSGSVMLGVFNDLSVFLVAYTDII